MHLRVERNSRLGFINNNAFYIIPSQLTHCSCRNIFISAVLKLQFLVLFRLPAENIFWHIQIVSRLILESVDTKKHMKCHFCKSDPSSILRWSELRFQSDFRKINNVIRLLLLQSNWISVFCVTGNMTHNDDFKWQKGRIHDLRCQVAVQNSR